MELRCRHCGHRWNYSGKSKYYASCPRCLWKVPLQTKKKQEPPTPSAVGPEHIDAVKFVDDYIGMRDWRVRENANVAYSFSSLFLQAAGETIARYTLSKVYPREIANAHIEGDFHIHNLQFGLVGYCLKPDTLILGDNKPISQYRPSDFVFGSSGKQNVLKTFSRQFSGKLIRLRACGILPIEVTPEHPILVAVRRGKPCEKKGIDFRWIPASNVVRFEGRTKGRKLCYLIIPRLSGTDTTSVLDLTPFAMRKSKNIKLKQLPLTTSTAWLLGLYVAEGYSYVSDREARTSISIGKHEIELRAKLEKALADLNLNYCIVETRTATHIELRYSVLGRALKKWCGKRATEKRIPEFVLLHENPQILKAFLSGYIAGDGKKEQQEKCGKSWYGARTRMWTVSKILALQLQLLCARLGIFASVCVTRKGGEELIEGRKVNTQDLFEISFYSHGSKYAQILPEMILTPLREKDEVPYEGTVCNLETDNHTYLASNVVIHNCAGWSIKDLLLRGFSGVPGRTESSPPKHFSSALLQISNFLGSIQNEWAGAQAVNSLDVYLAPFVRKDKLSYKQVKQAMQEYIYNLNIASRWGGQTPFTNVTFELKVPEDMKKESAIYGGKALDETYANYQPEADTINRAFLDVMLHGDMRGRIFTFPIPTYNVTKDFDWDSEVSDLLFQVTAKFGIPYFQNCIKGGIDPREVRAMCCRLQIDLKELHRRYGGFFGFSEKTGSVGVVTINMPRLGYLSKDEDEFFERLGRLMELAKESLEIKRKLVEQNMKRGLLPFSARYLGTLKFHFSTIGLVGMHEACLNLLGEGIQTKAGKDFAIKVLKFMRERLVEFQDETGNIYNLEATPAESSSHRLARLDKKRYPKIITAGKKVPYYTNSTWLPVGYTNNLVEALRHQGDLQTLYNGGTVFHGFLGEAISSPEGCKSLVRKIAKNFRIPYYTITPTFSICMEHGYLRGEHFKCPRCNKPAEVYSRVVGYYRSIANWHVGKQEEFRERLEYDEKVSMKEI